ncbi:NAD(P)/FAD-dependent oxidoreductase [candidate division WOR-3 bacterium]|nr:NAD(P)/FAD-dependent oxidoreductase [candidate division WOR-3 bacterium]
MRDVIIIGAGPAGSSLAYFLTKEGIDVLLLDKVHFPRYKPCAGAFSVSLINFFDFSLEESIERTHSSMTFRNGDNEFRLQLEFPVSHLVNRAHFDNLLVEKAIESGCSFIEGVNVLKIKGEKIITDSGEFKGKIIVGADGGGSIVRRYGKYRRIKSWIKTISADIPLIKYEEIIFDFSWTKKWYAWIFPKKDVLSVGIGDHPSRLSKPEAILQQFLEHYGLPFPETTYRYTYPLFSSPELLTWGNTLLIGDAAALANPVSGGGIYNGIESAYIASKVIKLNLSKGTSLLYYQKLVNKHIFPMLIMSRFFNSIFTISPIRVLKFGKFFFYMITKYFSSYKPPI